MEYSPSCFRRYIIYLMLTYGCYYLFHLYQPMKVDTENCASMFSMKTQINTLPRLVLPKSYIRFSPLYTQATSL